MVFGNIWRAALKILEKQRKFFGSFSDTPKLGLPFNNFFYLLFNIFWIFFENKIWRISTQNKYLCTAWYKM